MHIHLGRDNINASALSELLPNAAQNGPQEENLKGVQDLRGSYL